MKKIYLAGPDVFRANAKDFGEKLKEILKTNGLEGLFPLDNEIQGSSSEDTAGKIRNANIKMIEGCDGVIANLSSFRGPEPDSGTVWEVGYAQGLGKPVVGYCPDKRTLHAKTTSMLNLPDDAEYDADGLIIENFGLTHNLMFADIVISNNFEEAVQEISGSLKR